MVRSFYFPPISVSHTFLPKLVSLHGLWWHKILSRSFLQILVQIMTSVLSFITSHFKNYFSKIIPLTDFREDVPVSCSFIYFTEPATHTWGRLYPRVSGTAFKRFVSLLSFRVYSKESYVSLSVQNLFLPLAFSWLKVSARVKEKTVPWRHIPTPTAFPHGLQTSLMGSQCLRLMYTFRLGCP